MTAETLKAYAKAFADYIPPCPHNPFPANSPWGREIERRWKLEYRQRRQIGDAPRTSGAANPSPATL